MRRAFVAANWKMHGRLAMLSGYADPFMRYQGNGNGTDIVICPPAPYLHLMTERFARLPRITVGAQDCSAETKDGAYTGEVAAAMLADIGCRWVIVGHSERRRRHGETDAMVAAKFTAAREAGLTPILCVGETQAERSAGRAHVAVIGQLEMVLDRVNIESMDRAVVAYEPVWAIGTGECATPSTAEEMHRLVREAIAKRSGLAAETVRIVYGGSVTPENAAEFFEQPDVDGALVGGASLEPDDFLKIVAAAGAAHAA